MVTGLPGSHAQRYGMGFPGGLVRMHGQAGSPGLRGQGRVSMSDVLSVDQSFESGSAEVGLQKSCPFPAW